MVVSIHAPAKGATSLWGMKQPADTVSIHAPAKGATSRGSMPLLPRRVSIHAPAKRATVRRELISALELVSIHAPAKGATKREQHQADMEMFRSTPPRRGRRSTINAFCLQWNPDCPRGMVTSAETYEPSGAENFGKQHVLNRLNEARTCRGSR